MELTFLLVALILFAVASLGVGPRRFHLGRVGAFLLTLALDWTHIGSVSSIDKRTPDGQQPGRRLPLARESASAPVRVIEQPPLPSETPSTVLKIY